MNSTMSQSLASLATPYAREQQSRLRAAYGRHVIACVRAATEPLTFDQWFAKVIVATLSNS